MPNFEFDNPVLDSYIKGVQIKRQRDQDAFKNEMDKLASKRADEQLKQYGEHLKAEEAHQNAQLDLQRTQLGLESQRNQMQARQHIATMIGSGAMKTRQPTMGESLSTPVQGDFGGIDPRTISYATPQELLAQQVTAKRALGGVEAETAGLTKKAELTSALPFEQLKSSMASQQATDLQKLKGAQELEQIAKQTEGHLTGIDKTVEGNKAIARIHGQYALDAARIQNFTGISTPEEWSGAVLSRATGQAGLGPSKKDELIRAHTIAAGYIPFDPKDAAKLKELHSMDPLVSKMKQIIDNLPEGKMDALGRKIDALVPLTDRNNLNGLIAGVAGNIARTIGGERGVLTEKDLKRAGGLLVKEGITASQAKERFKFFLDNISSKGLGVYLSGQSPKQQLLNLRTYDFDPAIYNRIVTYKGKQDYAFKKSPDGEWGYFDEKSGTYKGMDE